MEDRWHGVSRIGVSGKREKGSHGSAQSECCLFLMRSLFIKSTQGDCVSA